ETTSTLVDNADGTFTYTDETGTPITFDANINDADADSTNEIQTISFTSPNLTLSDGGGTVDLSSLTGPTYTAGSGITIGGNLISAIDTSASNELQNLSNGGKVGNVQTININGGTGVSFSVADADSSVTNELQTLGISGDTLYLSNGGQVVLPAQPGDDWGVQTVVTNATLTGDGTSGNPLAVNGILTDNQNLSNGGKLGNLQTVNISGGTPVSFSVADADSSTTNEVITNFGLNGTLDSLVINEAGLNWAVPLSSLSNNSYWSLNGNTGTNPTNNFIGTIDNTALSFRTNNFNSGKLDPLNSNSFFGYRSGDVISTGTQNTAMGTNSLLANTTGMQNTAIGVASGQSNTIGSGNTFVGYYADASNINLTNATAIGANTIVAQSNSLILGNNANVGIGTSMPNSLLHLSKANSPTLYIQETTPANGSTIVMESSSQYALVSNQSGIFRIQNNTNSSNPFNISNTDNVGIGGDAQYSELDVFGKITMRTGATTGYIPVSDNNGTMTWTDPSSMFSGPWSKSGNIIYPTVANDSIGIGTISPGARFHITNGQIFSNWLSPNGPANLFISNFNSGSGPGYMTGTLGQVTITTSDAAEAKYAIQAHAGGSSGNKYGTFSTASGTGNTNIGGYFEAFGAATNWAGYFENGNVYIKDTLLVNTFTGKSKVNVNGDIGFGGTPATNNAIVIILQNTGASAIAAGDIVVTGGADNSCATTNANGSYSVLGVATEVIPLGAVGKIAISGVVKVNVVPTSVAIGNHCITGNISGRARGIVSPSAGTSIGVFITNESAGQATVLLR
ncbi:MAG: hypothetical protein IT232_11945, partial [Flavobacteriales bacterium]|nr:hypothetical protein [Flavobacteriales bacterium]